VPPHEAATFSFDFIALVFEASYYAINIVAKPLEFGGARGKDPVSNICFERKGNQNIRRAAETFDVP
jgi:hypothetical protein